MALTMAEANIFTISLSAGSSRTCNKDTLLSLRDPSSPTPPKSTKHLPPMRLFGLCVTIVHTAVIAQTLNVRSKTWP